MRKVRRRLVGDCLKCGADRAGRMSQPVVFSRKLSKGSNDNINAALSLAKTVARKGNHSIFIAKNFTATYITKHPF